MQAVSLKNKLGCWAHERWRTEFVLRMPGLARFCRFTWRDLRNRNEKIGRGVDGARICKWTDSSVLTVTRFFPEVGGRLITHCFDEWPIKLSKEFYHEDHQKDPEISVILPVCGKDRIPLFKCVLYSFFGQTCRNLDIIVVENGTEPLYKAFCPTGVKYIFLPMWENREFNKCKAMNEGVRKARAPYVLLHDADIVIPCSYVESIIKRLKKGWDAVRPIRFAFNLNSYESKKFMNFTGQHLPGTVESVLQNFPGLSTAVTKLAFKRIGGCDEQFEGWGGEDLEFLDRLKVTKLFPGSYAPGVHLWHAPAPKKESGDRNLDLLLSILKIPVTERINMLQRCLDN